MGRNGERLKSAAKELSDATGQECLPVAADVRKPDTLTEAVKQTIEKFGRIDFVICGPWVFLFYSLRPLYASLFGLWLLRRCFHEQALQVITSPQSRMSPTTPSAPSSKLTPSGRTTLSRRPFLTSVRHEERIYIFRLHSTIEGRRTRYLLWLLLDGICCIE